MPLNGFQGYDQRLSDYESAMLSIHGGNFRQLTQKQQPRPEAGHVIVRKELDALNKRFSNLISLIVERRTVLEKDEQRAKEKVQMIHVFW